MKRSKYVQIGSVAVAGILLIGGYFVQRQWRIHSAIANLKSHDADVRAQAAFTLGNMGARSGAVVPALVEVLVHEEYSSHQVANSLVRIGAAAVPHLLDALNDETARLRHWGATTTGATWETPRLFWALGELRSDPRVAAALNEALGDDDRHVRSAAAYALGIDTTPGEGPGYRITRIDPHVSPERELRRWTKHLQHPDPVVRSWAADHLGELGPEAQPAVPALEAALKDDDARVRQAASWALTQTTGSSGPAEALRRGQGTQD